MTSITPLVHGWVVAQTKAQRELYASENLARQNYEHYFPRIAFFQPKLRRVIAQPLFPSYIFVRVEGRWLSLLSTYGITRLVCSTSNRPAIIAQAEIDKLKAREDEDGLVCLDQAPIASRLKRGDKVRVRDGALLAGACGIHDGLSAQDRVRVLMDYLGRKTKVLVPESLLEIAV